MNIWPCKNCIKTQERENRRDLYTPALSLFNYHTKFKYKCLYQFLINIMLSISIRQISEILKQRLNFLYRPVSIWKEREKTNNTKPEPYHNIYWSALKDPLFKFVLNKQRFHKISLASSCCDELSGKRIDMRMR